MMNNKTVYRSRPDLQARNVSTRRKFIVFSILLYLVILIGGSVAFVLIMSNVLYSNSGYELSKTIEVERLKLENIVNGEIALVLNMANSPALKRYFENPANRQLKETAFEELANREAYIANTLFWVNDIDKIFYVNGGYTYVVNPDDPATYWYNMTMRDTEKYNFNINYNPDLNNLNLWINAPVFNDSGRTLGIFGVGIDLSSFVNSLYGEYSEAAELYFFNKEGEITGAADVELAKLKVKIYDRLDIKGKEIFEHAQSLHADEIVYFRIDNWSGTIAVGKVQALDWYIAAVLPFDIIDALPANMTVLFIAMMIVIASVLIVFNLFGMGVVGPLNEMLRTIMESIGYASKIQRNLLPDDRAFKEAFADYSIIWEPRDTVGGDIYWMKRFDKGTVLCMVDCTGHGTPGAMLTMLVTSAFEAIIRSDNCHDTADIVYQLDRRLAEVLHAGTGAGSITDISDGCDIAVLFIGSDGGVTFSSGRINVFVCDGVDVTRHKGQKISVGEGRLASRDEVETIRVAANPANKFYIASDGLYDQPGGERGKTYGVKELCRIVIDNHREDQAVISGKIWDAFEKYRGGQPRVDDFSLITFKPYTVEEQLKDISKN